MKYLHTYSGRRSRMPTRQSNSVGSNSCATISSERPSSSWAFCSSSASFSTLTTPAENALSGCFSTTGSDSVGMIWPTFSRCTISVRGAGTPCRVSSSARYTLLVHLRIDSGSSITTRPSAAARRAKR